ncbi:MAG TPA: DoxX family protein [Vicinamibacteria bacterium]|nr:DoxX family protein [Vicinamibacteria bacterium]
MVTLRAGEILLAFIFIAGGLSTLRNPMPRVEEIARLHFPFPALAVRVNAAMMMVAGAALALNIQARLASGVLAVLLALTTAFGHAFWTEQGPRRELQAVNFFKNLAILGGLLLVTQIR